MALQAAQRLFRRQRIEQGLAQSVLPGGHRRGDIGFERRVVHIAALEGAAAPHHHMQPGVARQRDLDLRLDIDAAEPGEQQLFDAAARLGVVAVAGHEHHAGPETARCVVAHDETGGAALVQVDRAAHEADEFGDARLEQFIARPCLEHGEHRLAVVALRVEAEALDHRGDLAPHHRDLGGRGEVGGRGPQADEAVLADHAAGRVEFLDSNLVEMARSVHGGAARRFADA